MSLSRRTESSSHGSAFSHAVSTASHWAAVGDAVSETCWTASKTAFPEYRTAAIEPMLIPKYKQNGKTDAETGHEVAPPFS